MPLDIYTKIKRAEYRELVQRVNALEAENAELKANINGLITKLEKTAETKTETKKGGNK